VGIAGRIARFFQSARITPLLALVALLMGLFAAIVTPREEEPQINVTMANVLIPFRAPRPGKLNNRSPDLPSKCSEKWQASNT